MKYFALFIFLSCGTAHASIEWTLKNQVNIEASPLDTVPSSDGKTIYILVSGKILVYSMSENRIIDFFPVDRKFDHLSVAGKGKLFLLSSSKDTSISIFEMKKTFDLSGLSIKGPQDAPVVVAVFSDYQ